ncbi:MAG: LPXTG cell wall anchor domain-containing protein [Firmicutes bacterium]|nr:LPXTG cell wall anchor domain-containing protein [Bacillota bacterium]
MSKQVLLRSTISLLLIVLFSIASVMANGGDTIFFEDFESYAEGAYPTSFAIRYNGTGDANQKVIATVGWQGGETNVFRLQGAGGWSSEQLYTLPSALPEVLVISARVKPVSGSSPGRIGLYNPNVGTWGTRISAVLFEGGFIQALKDGTDIKVDLNRSYTAGNWYLVEMKHDMIQKTYDVYLDGEKIGEEIAMHPTVTSTHLNLTSGNIGTNEIYFDDVLVTLPDTTPPVLTAGLAKRTADTGATVTFTSNEAGSYYYAVADSGAPEPEVDTGGSGTACTAAETEITLDGLTPGTKEIYIKVKDAAGNVSAVLKMEIPPFLPGVIQFDSGGLGTYEGAQSYIYVLRTGGTDGVVSVAYTAVEGTAKAGLHYGPPYSGTLTWADGDGSYKYIPYLIYDDDIYSGYLDYSYILSDPVGGAVLGERSVYPVRISDNDPPPVPAGLAAAAGDGEVTLTWSMVNSARYILYCSTSPEDFTDAERVELYEEDETSYTFTGLENGSAYHFAIGSGHDIYYSALSETVTATPAAPAYALTLIAGEGGRVAGGGNFAAGETPEILAIPDSGYEFAGWTSPDDIVFEDAASVGTTMTMPAFAVTATAHFVKVATTPEEEDRAEEIEEPEPEAALPKTGGTPAEMISGVGMLLAAAGAAISRKRKR